MVKVVHLLTLWPLVVVRHEPWATGCILTVKALYELQRVSGQYALVMCIGGAQGVAAVYERF